LPVAKRETFRWKHLLQAPLLLIPLADPTAYVERYAEPDKARTGLGEGVDAWPAPYWTIDTSMAVMTLLHAAQDEGLGALFFGVFQRETEVRAEFAIPEGMQVIGAIAIGHPLDEEAGRSVGRARRSPDEIIHRGRFRGPVSR
jgi:nitroreductase